MMKILILSLILTSTLGFHLPKNGKIIGGQDADIKNHPYQVSLQYSKSHECGGAIISEKFVVTSASCISDSNILTVVAGVTNIEEEGGQVIKVAGVYRHPQFSIVTSDYDIVVLELQEAIVFNEKAMPIAMPAVGSDPEAGSDAVCTGWGETSDWRSKDSKALSDVLQRIDIQIVDRQKCQEQYEKDTITDRMICAGVPDGSKDTCVGDDGSPLVANDQLVGVMSWGHGCLEGNTRPSVYTRVAEVRDFIREISGV